MARPRILSIPLEAVWNHPAYWRLTAAGRGMLHTILERFWRGGARPLELNHNALIAMAATQPHHFTRYAPDIIEVLADVTPSLTVEHGRRMSAARQLRIAAAHGGQAAAARKRQREAEARLAAQPSALDTYLPTAHGIPVTDAKAVTRSPAKKAPAPNAKIFSDTPRR